MKKLLSILTMFGALGVHAAGTDEQWEMTSSMEMQGMKMPASKTTFCMAKGGDYNPDTGPDKNCKISDMHSSGNTSRWKMVCTGKNAMEGSGEMTRTPDTMSQNIKMTMGGQTMTMVGVGKRIGSCDAAADKKKALDQAASGISKMCAAQVENTYQRGGFEDKMPEMWSRPQQCASSKATLCEKARGYVGNGSYAEYTTYANSKGWVAAECGINVEARRVELCKRAVTEKQNPFIKERCPIEAKVFADDYAKNCQGFGRDYTADLARPNAKQCTALRFWAVKPVKGAAGNPGTGKSAIGTVPLERQTLEPAAKPNKAAAVAEKQAAAEKQATNKNDNPGAALLDSVKGLKDKFKF